MRMEVNVLCKYEMLFEMGVQNLLQILDICSYISHFTILGFRVVLPIKKRI